MHFISTRVHGMLDYPVGALLLVSPWLFGFAGEDGAMWVPVILGAGVILYSLFTDYELGVVRKITMPVHLWLDFLGGFVLAVSPWIFDFAEHVWAPHLVIGLLEIGTALMTEKAPAAEAIR